MRISWKEKVVLYCENSLISKLATQPNQVTTLEINTFNVLDSFEATFQFLLVHRFLRLK